MNPLTAAVLPFTPTSQATLSLREIPVDEQPRNRLLAHGAGALADAELVALLLASGTPQASALDLARALLSAAGGLNGLIGASPRALQTPGIGAAKAATLLAAIELGTRLARLNICDREPLLHPAAVARYLILKFSAHQQEVMGALYLDIRGRIVAERELFRGTINRLTPDPRTILKEALITGASGLILFHTHPSGDPSPSAEDLFFTRRLSEAADLLGIQLKDHLILGHGGSWLSLRERGGWS